MVYWTATVLGGIDLGDRKACRNGKIVKAAVCHFLARGVSKVRFTAPDAPT